LDPTTNTLYYLAMVIGKPALLTDADIAVEIGLAGMDPSQPPHYYLLERARILLAAGADPNEQEPVNGVTPLGVLGRMCRGSIDPAVEMALLLLEHGANPLRLDKPLGSQIKHDHSSLLTTSLVSAINKLEFAAHGLRTDNGGNILHYLAKSDPDMAAGFLEEDAYCASHSQQGPLLELFFQPHLLNQRDNDGDTPLHAIWRDVEAYGGEAVGLCWKMTAALLDCGANPLECAVAKGLPLMGHEATWGLMLARLSQSRLEISSPQSPLLGKRAARL
jgi:hypothetical protein